MLPAVRDDCDRPLPAVHLIELVVRNFRRNSSKVCLSNFSYGILNWSSGRKSFLFPQVLIKVVSLEFNVFNFIRLYIVITHK